MPKKKLTGLMLRSLRNEAGLTQQDLATLAGCTVTTISLWENDEVPIRDLQAMGLRSILLRKIRETTREERAANEC